MILIDHYVAQSPIHGLGVFSSEIVTKGSLIWEFNAIIDRDIPVSSLSSLPPHVIKKIHKHAWFHPETQSFWLSADGDYFMNYSENPTFQLKGLSFVASRNIEIGDELTCDYRVVQVLDYRLSSEKTVCANERA